LRERRRGAVDGTAAALAGAVVAEAADVARAPAVGREDGEELLDERLEPRSLRLAESGQRVRERTLALAA
jgi:hypothetical protein